jgi:hypothetical protein
MSLISLRNIRQSDYRVKESKGIGEDEILYREGVDHVSVWVARKEFEKWAVLEGYSTARYMEGYDDIEVNFIWLGWLACANSEAGQVKS